MARIVVLASYAPSLVLFRRTFLQRLIGRGHEVIACAPPDDAVSRRLAEFGVRFEAIGPSRTSVNPFDDIRYCWQLIRFLRRVRPTAVFAYTAKPVIWGTLVASLIRVPKAGVMITGLGHAFVDSSRSKTAVGRIVRFLYSAALSKADKIAFQNPDDLSEFLRLGLVRDRTRTFVVNGSGIELDAFSPVSIPNKCSFLLIARLLSDKGIREYVNAARIVRKKYPEAVFVLVGWFDDNPAAISREEIAHWVSEGVVDFRGFKDDVRAEIAAAAVYVLPSYREGTPRTVLEAMAMARPIITTNVPGCRETVVDGENGFLVPVRDSVALAEAMERFLANGTLASRMGRRSRELAESKYDAVKVADSLIQLLGLES